MNFSPELIALAGYLAGEFDNIVQASTEPVWYVPLYLWHRPLPIQPFPDSITLFIEQANTLTLDQPYRQRVMQLCSSAEYPERIQVQYYRLQDLEAVQGGGRSVEILKQLTPEELEFLPGCRLEVTYQQLTSSTYQFKANLPENTRCCFTEIKAGLKPRPSGRIILWYNSLS